MYVIKVRFFLICWERCTGEQIDLEHLFMCLLDTCIYLYLEKYVFKSYTHFKLVLRSTISLNFLICKIKAPIGQTRNTLYKLDI